MATANVYIVTSGVYSDYHIVAVFSTQEAAQTYADNSGGRHARAQEWPLDPSSHWGHQTSLTMTRDGEARNCHANWAARPQTRHRLSQHHAGAWLLCVTVPTGDKTTAIKVANEIRTGLIAADQWPAADASSDASSEARSPPTSDWKTPPATSSGSRR